MPPSQKQKILKAYRELSTGEYRSELVLRSNSSGSHFHSDIGRRVSRKGRVPGSIISSSLDGYILRDSESGVEYINQPAFQAYAEHLITGGKEPPSSISSNPEMQERLAKGIDEIYADFEKRHSGLLTRGEFERCIKAYTRASETPSGLYFVDPLKKVTV